MDVQSMSRVRKLIVAASENLFLAGREMYGWPYGQFPGQLKIGMRSYVRDAQGAVEKLSRAVLRVAQHNAIELPAEHED